MKKLAFIVAAASLFALSPFVNRFGVVGSSLVLVWLCVLLAITASGALGALTIASGAAGAFGAGILASVSPAAAGAVLIGAAFAERTTRVRTSTARAVHVLLALAAGALAGSLTNAFVASSLPVLLTAVVVGAVLVALPLLVAADDPIAHALERAALAVPEPSRAALLAGADLRRNAEEVPLDRATLTRVTQTWRSLLKLAEARVRLARQRSGADAKADANANADADADADARDGKENAGAGGASTRSLSPVNPSASDAVLAMVDQRIGEHVAALTKAITAVDTAHAAEIGLRDADLRTIESVGDSLEDASRAMVEMKTGTAS